jgi:hypothetical protein
MLGILRHMETVKYPAMDKRKELKERTRSIRNNIGETAFVMHIIKHNIPRIL